MIARTLVLPIVAFTTLLACNSSSPDVATKAEKIELSLDVDIRDHADAVLTVTGDAIDTKLTLGRGFGVVPDDQLELHGKGTLERFPEADLALYTARFSVPAVSDGPCKDQPVSLALALHRRGAAARFAGSLTAYCGENVWAGTPARNPLRLSRTRSEDSPEQ
jgi:hypothetical protein